MARLKDALGKPFFTSKSAAKMFASRRGLARKRLRWGAEELAFVENHQNYQIEELRKEILKKFGKKVTYRQLQYKRRELKHKRLKKGIPLCNQDADSVESTPAVGGGSNDVTAGTADQ